MSCISIVLIGHVKCFVQGVKWFIGRVVVLLKCFLGSVNVFYGSCEVL